MKSIKNKKDKIFLCKKTKRKSDNTDIIFKINKVKKNKKKQNNMNQQLILLLKMKIKIKKKFLQLKKFLYHLF